MLWGALLMAAAVPSGFFAPRMMLPRDTSVPVWGTAHPGERVTVLFGDLSASATADDKGRWMAELPPLAASAEGRTLEIRGTDGVTALPDVIVGDVFLSAGQSNMQFPLCGRTARQHDAKGNALVQLADDRQIRFAAPRRAWALVPTNDVALVWKRGVCDDLRDVTYTGTHEEGSTSAIAYYFARYVNRASGVPVGFVDVSRGGAFIDPFFPPEAVAEKQTFSWRRNGGHQSPGVLWNAMIAPMTRFPFKGVLWYQGESNKNDTNGVYLAKFRALVKSWRRAFDTPKLPFYFVQLAPHAAGHLSVQLQQAAYAREDPYAPMTVVSDLGCFRNIHPRDKDTVGLRIALRVLKREYGFSELRDASPEPVKAAVRADGMVAVSFAHAEWLYVINDDMSLFADFELKGSDGRWRPAKIMNFRDTWVWYQKRNVKNGEIDGSEILLAAPDVSAPVAVRYLHNAPWKGTVFNDVSLPLGPFEIPIAK